MGRYRWRRGVNWLDDQGRENAREREESIPLPLTFSSSSSQILSTTLTITLLGSVTNALLSQSRSILSFVCRKIGREPNLISALSLYLILTKYGNWCERGWKILSPTVRKRSSGHGATGYKRGSLSMATYSESLLNAICSQSTSEYVSVCKVCSEGFEYSCCEKCENAVRYLKK